MLSSAFFYLLWFTQTGCFASRIPRNLFQVTKASSSQTCCKGEDLLSCQDVVVNPKILNTKEDIWIADVVVSFKWTVPPNGYVYENQAGDEAVISFNEKTGNMFGSFHTSGRSFAIEKCSLGHVWKEYNVSSFEPDLVVEPDTVDEASSRRVSEPRNSDTNLDTTTPATFSVMFYYTDAFQASEEDIPGFINQVLAETNTGYKNSKVPITVTKFCIEAATINEMRGSTLDFINAFAKMKGTVSALRNTADFAVLLSMDIRSCGRASKIDGIKSGNTISIVRKSCALGDFSFGHELGHNMGLGHNKERNPNEKYPYGHGHLIEKGRARTGYRTILSYYAPGHRVRVNFYSNPDQIFNSTGTSLGEEGVANNWLVLMENRFAMQAVGNEKGTCSDGSAPEGKYKAVGSHQDCDIIGREITDESECRDAAEILGLDFIVARWWASYQRNCWLYGKRRVYFNNNHQGIAPRSDRRCKAICATNPALELEPVSATQSSTHSDGWGTLVAGNCIDGDTDTLHGLATNGICHTKGGEDTPWIAIDYGTRVLVERVELFNRADAVGSRTQNVDVRISDQLPTSADQMFSGGSLLGHFAGPGTDGQHIIISGQETPGRYVIVQMDNGGEPLNLQEVKAFGRTTSP